MNVFIILSFIANTIYLTGNDVLHHQKLCLRNIDSTTFELYYLLSFQAADSSYTFVVSKKNEIVSNENKKEYQPLYIEGIYEVPIMSIDSVTHLLYPVRLFNTRTALEQLYICVGDNSDNKGAKKMPFFNWTTNTFMVPLYESPDIVGLHIKVGKAQKE